MPKFCRHGTVIESCPICRVEIEIASRSDAARVNRPRATRRPSAAVGARTPGRARGGLTIRHESRAADDGYRSALAPGLRSTPDAQRLAEELGRASARLQLLATAPTGLYAVVAAEGDLEEASWLALLISFIGPLEGVEDPFAEISAARTTWRSGALPELSDVQLGPRTSHDAARGEETLLAYRRWAKRAGSQAAAFNADPAWTPQQRFERVFERLALPGLHRRARYDLLVTLGALERYPLRAPGLLLSEDDPVMRAAKRVFGIGDRLTLERRARDLATAVTVPVEALDPALDWWARSERISPDEDERDEDVVARALAALDR